VERTSGAVWTTERRLQSVQQLGNGESGGGRIFQTLASKPDAVGSIADGTVMRAHQGAANGKGGSSAMLWIALAEASPQGSTHSLLQVDVRSTSRSRKGQRHEMIAAPGLLDHACGKAFIGDTGYDSDEFRTAIRKKERLPVILNRRHEQPALGASRTCKN
jgi:hypothetical protein